MTEPRLAINTPHLTEVLDGLGKRATDSTGCGIHDSVLFLEATLEIRFSPEKDNGDSVYNCS